MSDNPLPLLALQQVTQRRWSRGIVHHELRVDLRFDRPEVIGVFGPNGAGKSTLLDLVAGRAAPAEGRVCVRGHDLAGVQRDQRRRLVHHLAQPRLATPQLGRRDALVLRPMDLYQELREAMRDRRRTPAPPGGPHVHVFDEPPLAQPYGGLFFDRFERLRADGVLVFFSAHPSEPWHLDRIEETCDRLFFVSDGQVRVMHSFAEFIADAEVRDYLSALEFAEAAAAKALAAA